MNGLREEVARLVEECQKDQARLQHLRGRLRTWELRKFWVQRGSTGKPADMAAAAVVEIFAFTAVPRH